MCGGGLWSGPRRARRGGGLAWFPHASGDSALGAGAMLWVTMNVSRGVVSDSLPFSLAGLLVGLVRKPESPGALWEARLSGEQSLFSPWPIWRACPSVAGQSNPALGATARLRLLCSWSASLLGSERLASVLG